MIHLLVKSLYDAEFNQRPIRVIYTNIYRAERNYANTFVFIQKIVILRRNLSRFLYRINQDFKKPINNTL